MAAPVSSSVVWGRFTGFNAFSLWHLQAVGGIIIPCLRFLQSREVSSSAFPTPQYLGIVWDTVSRPFSLPPVGRCVIVHLKSWFFQKFLIAVFQSEAVAFRPDSSLCSSSSEESLKIATWAPADALLLMYVKDLMVLLICLRGYYPLHPRASPGNQMGSGHHNSPCLCEAARGNLHAAELFDALSRQWHFKMACLFPRLHSFRGSSTSCSSLWGHSSPSPISSVFVSSLGCFPSSPRPQGRGRRHLQSHFCSLARQHL